MLWRNTLDGELIRWAMMDLTQEPDGISRGQTRSGFGSVLVPELLRYAICQYQVLSPNF